MSNKNDKISKWYWASIFTKNYSSSAESQAAKDFNVDILGKIPIDTNIVKSGDQGQSYLDKFADSASAKEMQKIVKKITEKIK